MAQENPPETLDPFLGCVVQGYQIQELIGKGGVGRVYLAHHTEIGARIAIKVLKESLSESEAAIQRFFREAKSVNEIRHENLINIFNFSYNPKNKEAFLLMEYLEGKPLSAVIRAEGPLDLQRIGHISLQLCSALYAAHRVDIIHRDLKSDNVFLIDRAGQKDFVKLLDFGLVKLHDTDEAPITSIGVTLGTPTYMSPEQAVGEVVDARADLYSLGVILYEMATRTLPFTAPNIRDIMKKQVMAPLPPPRERNPEINPDLEAVIKRCLEKEKSARFSSMLELAQALAKACGLETSAYFGERLAPARFTAAARAEEASRILTESLPLPLATTMQVLPPTIEAEMASLPSVSSLATEFPSSGSFRSAKVRTRRFLLGAASLLILLPILWFTFGTGSSEVTQPTQPASPKKSSVITPIPIVASSPVFPATQPQNKTVGAPPQSQPSQSKVVSKPTKGEPPKEKKPANPTSTPVENNDDQEKPIRVGK